jgi:hypothetical protein
VSAYAKKARGLPHDPFYGYYNVCKQLLSYCGHT